MNTKKYIIRAFIIIGIVLAVLTVVSLILWAVSGRTKAEPEYDYDFYEPDFALDINDYPEYLEKDRSIKYTDETRQQIEITEDNYKKQGDTAEFFYKYFKAVKEGDHEAYNSLFEDKYFKKRDKQSRFTKQMVYDIDLRFMSKTEIDNDTDAVQYTLKYSIYRNDGTFREDIGSDMSRKQFITVYYNLKTGEAKIHNIQTEYYLN
ncbi:MAG: hypothetical protein E7591_10425 [Ruminococcaceae bacterium]|nr:hypothetical protein [Oscillospiraceae bacterium]